MRLIKPATRLKLQFAWHWRCTCPSGSIYYQVHWEWLKIVINSYFKSKMSKYKNLLVLFPLQRSSLQAYPIFLPFAWIHWYPSFNFVSSLQYLMSNQKFIDTNVISVSFFEINLQWVSFICSCLATTQKLLSEQSFGLPTSSFWWHFPSPSFWHWWHFNDDVIFKSRKSKNNFDFMVLNIKVHWYDLIYDLIHGVKKCYQIHHRQNLQ